MVLVQEQLLEDPSLEMLRRSPAPSSGFEKSLERLLILVYRKAVLAVV
jgi:hypothetical protein